MYTLDTPPGLIVGYECGRLQLLKNERDVVSPIMIDTMMKIFSIKWNHNGTIFAVAGSI